MGEIVSFLVIDDLLFVVLVEVCSVEHDLFELDALVCDVLEFCAHLGELGVGLGVVCEYFEELLLFDGYFV